MVDERGTPLAIKVCAANHHDTKLIEPTLDQLNPKDRVPEHLIYDTAADSDPLRITLAGREIELICPHRKGRKKKPTQDRRALRRYKKRYKVERTHAWFHNYRRTIIRYETTMRRYRGWVYLAAALVTTKRF